MNMQEGKKHYLSASKNKIIDLVKLLIEGRS